MKILTAWAVRAAARLGVECRDGHVETTSRRLWGDDPWAAEQDVPCRVPDGDRQAKRPDLKPLVLALLGVERTVPMWGKPADGHAADKPLNTTVFSAIAARLARHGVAPGAYLDVADAALVTADNLAARGKTLVISRLPATSTACERVIQEALARDGWEDIGILATTPATKRRPATDYQAYEGEVAL